MTTGMILSIMAFIFALGGVCFLWVLFFSNKGDGKKVRDGKIEKVQSLIQQVEKENPDLVQKLRNQMVADAKLKSAKDSNPEDISMVVKHWLEAEGDRDK